MAEMCVGFGRCVLGGVQEREGEGRGAREWISQCVGRRRGCGCRCAWRGGVGTAGGVRSTFMRVGMAGAGVSMFEWRLAKWAKRGRCERARIRRRE